MTIATARLNPKSRYLKKDEISGTPPGGTTTPGTQKDVTVLLSEATLAARGRRSSRFGQNPH